MKQIVGYEMSDGTIIHNYDKAFEHQRALIFRDFLMKLEEEFNGMSVACEYYIDFDIRCIANFLQQEKEVLSKLLLTDAEDQLKSIESYIGKLDKKDATDPKNAKAEILGIEQRKQWSQP